MLRLREEALWLPQNPLFCGVAEVEKTSVVLQLIGVFLTLYGDPVN